MGKYKNFILETGVAVSMTGKIRIFEEVFGEDHKAKAKALRAGYNHLIQTTASDIMLLCLVYVERLMRKNNLASMLVTTVHDSLAVDTLKEELPIVHEIVDGVVNNIPDIIEHHFGSLCDTSWCRILPLEGDSEVGTSLGTAFKLSRTPNWDEVYHKLAMSS
jgi:hypothetical protein